MIRSARVEVEFHRPVEDVERLSAPLHAQASALQPETAADGAEPAGNPAVWVPLVLEGLKLLADLIRSRRK